MQKTSTEKVQSLAERIRSGESKYFSIKQLTTEAEEFFEIAMDSEPEQGFELGIEYCRAACEDLGLVYERAIGVDEFERTENFEGKNQGIANKINEVMFYQHRLQANIYLTEKRYHMVLEEVAAAKELYNTLLEDNEKLNSVFKLWEHDISRLEGIAKEKLGNPIEMPRMIFLQNMLDLALAEERYEDSAMLRDKIKALEEKELAKV